MTVTKMQATQRRRYSKNQLLEVAVEVVMSEEEGSWSVMFMFYGVLCFCMSIPDIMYVVWCVFSLLLTSQYSSSFYASQLECHGQRLEC